MILASGREFDSRNTPTPCFYFCFFYNSTIAFHVSSCFLLCCSSCFTYDQLRSIKGVRICREAAQLPHIHSVGYSTSSGFTKISTFVPTYYNPYMAHILLATTNVTTTYLLQDGISHLITPVACSNQSAAELAKLLRSILLCNKSNSCFFRTNLSSRNP